MMWNRFQFGSLREEAGSGSEGSAPAPAAPASAPESSAPAPLAPSTPSEGVSAFADVVDHVVGPRTATSAPAPVTPVPVAPVAAPVPVAPVPAVPIAPVAPVAPIAPVPQVPMTPPPSMPIAAAPSAPTPTAAPPGPDPVRYQQVRDQAVADLARAYSNFSEEERVALLTQPETVLPQLLARAQIDSYEYTMRSLTNVIPQIVQSVMAQNTAESAAQDQFFSMYPALRSHPQGIETVARVGWAYKQANPQTPPEQLMQVVGMLASATLGLPLAGQSAQPSGPPPPAPTPFLPPHSPAGVGGSAVPPPPRDDSPWADLLHLRRV